MEEKKSTVTQKKKKNGRKKDLMEEKDGLRRVKTGRREDGKTGRRGDRNRRERIIQNRGSDHRLTSTCCDDELV